MLVVETRERRLALQPTSRCCVIIEREAEAPGGHRKGDINSALRGNFVKFNTVDCDCP
jgi:hypothetical protein